VGLEFSSSGLVRFSGFDSLAFCSESFSSGFEYFSLGFDRFASDFDSFSSRFDFFDIFNRIVRLNGLREMSFFSADVTSSSRTSVRYTSLDFRATCHLGTIPACSRAQVSISGQQERGQRKLDLYFAWSLWRSRWVYVAS